MPATLAGWRELCADFGLRPVQGALGFARAGCDACVLKKSALTNALAPLPLAVLEPEVGELGALHAMGVRTLRDGLRLPRDGLARRFGPELLQVLDRALGRNSDPRPPFEPPPRFDARVALPAEVSETEALLFAARRLLLELCGVLRARGGGVQSLVLRLFHRAQAVSPVPLGLVAPSRDPHHLLGLLRERLERVRLTEPVREIGLAADVILPLDASNLDLFGAPGAPDVPWAASIAGSSVRHRASSWRASVASSPSATSVTSPPSGTASEPPGQKSF